MPRAIDLLKNKFGVSQLYQYEIKQDGEVLLVVHWHPLTIAEREAIQQKGGEDPTGSEFALNLMIQKALDENGKRLFQEGDRAALKREVEASILQEIQLAMLTSGTENTVEEAQKDLKS